MKYLRLFNNHADYVTFTSGIFDMPNVSYCLDAQDVHFNPTGSAGGSVLMVTYTVEDASNPTLLYGYYEAQEEGDPNIYGVNMFDKVEIDGTEVSISSLDTAQGQYQLSIGEHTVAYTLKNPTILGVLISEQIGTFTIGATFFQCSTITSVEMPSSVTSIGINAFGACTSLTSITIPSGVTTILNNAFGQCCSLDEDTIDFILSINQNAWSCSN